MRSDVPPASPVPDAILELPAQIEREFGPYPDFHTVHGVSYDGVRVWCAGGDKLYAIDPNSGAQVGVLAAVPAEAGTAFDGTHLYQLSGGRIFKLDPRTGEVLATLDAPEPADDNAGLTWAEGSLWLGRHRAREILQLDPRSGAVLQRLRSDRFVTGVTFAGDELWHGTLEDGASELREVDARTGRVLTRVRMPAGATITGLESDGGERLFCGGGRSGRLRVLRKPKRSAT